MDHFRNPRHKVEGEEGELKMTNKSVIHQEKNLSCGDEITVAVELDGDVIKDIQWTGTGCAISQAGMSMMAEELIGKTKADIINSHKDDIYTLLGVPIGPRRIKCALLCMHTVKNALRKAEGLEAQGWLETVKVE